MKKRFPIDAEWLAPLILLFSLIPVMMYQSGGNFISQWVTLCLLWGLALWYARKPNDYLIILRDKAFLVYFLFILWAFFHSLFWSTAEAISLFSVFTFFGGLLTYFIGYASSHRSARLFYVFLLAFGLLLCVYTYYQAFILHISRPMGMLGNWNTHAALLAIILLPTIILKALTEKVPTLVLSIQTILLGLFAFAISLTLSRGVLIIFACAILFSVILAWRKKFFFKQGAIFLTTLVVAYLLQSFLTADSVISRININSASRGIFIIFAGAILLSVLIAWRKKPYFKKGVLLLIILVAGYLLHLFLTSEAVISDLNIKTELTPLSITALGSGRHLLWQPAWQMFLDRPFLGWGLGVFYLLYPQYKAPLTNEAGFFAHNDYLQVLVELGPMGLILLTAFVFIIVKRLWQLAFAPGFFSEYEIEALALLATCVGLLAHTFFTFHLYQLTVQIIFGFYLGRAAKLLHTEYAKPAVPIPPMIAKRFKSIYISVCVLVVLSSGLLGLAYYNLNKATEVTDLGQSLTFYRKAGEFFPSLNRYEFFSAVDLVKQLNATKSLKQRNEIKSLALQRIDRAIEKMSIDAKNYAVKAEILRATQGDFKATSAAYEQALKLNPSMLRLRYDYTKYLLAYRQYPKALAILWAGWDRLNIGAYQNGVAFLSFHLAVNQKMGQPQDNALIAQEIQRLLALKRSNSQGLYVLHRPSP